METQGESSAIAEDGPIDNYNRYPVNPFAIAAETANLDTRSSVPVIFLRGEKYNLNGECCESTRLVAATPCREDLRATEVGLPAHPPSLLSNGPARGEGLVLRVVGT